MSGMRIKARLGHHLGNVRGYLYALSFFPLPIAIRDSCVYTLHG